MLTSTIDKNKILPKEKKLNVDKADPNVEDKNSAIFLVSKYVNAAHWGLSELCLHVR